MSFMTLVEEFRYAMRHPGVRSGWWVSIVALGALGLVAVLWWWPTQREHDRVLDRIEFVRREIITARQSEQIARAFEKARAEIPLIQKKLDSGAGQAQLVDGLTQLARRSGVRLLAESYEDSRIKSASYQPLVADIAIQGSYGSLRIFLAGLSTLPLWGELQEIKLERMRDTAVLKGQLRLVLFRRLPAAEPGASAS